jgi:hypothetical protein
VRSLLMEALRLPQERESHSTLKKQSRIHASAAIVPLGQAASI